MIRNLMKIRFLVTVILSLGFVFLTITFLRRQTNCKVVFEESNQEINSDSQVASENVTEQPTLAVPKDISEVVGADEWISRTITDNKRECPPLLNDATEKEKSNMSCQIPALNPFHPSMLQLRKNVVMPNCASYKSYGELVDGKINFIDPDVVSATYRSILRQGDFNFILGKSVPLPKTEKIKDEFIEVDYLFKDGKHATEIFLQPVPHQHLLKREAQKKPGIALNILILGIDSLAHANAQRNLPKVYEFLKKDLGAFIFNGLSIVGDGTTEQLAAMLTGLGELEQYESRRHHKNPRPVDGWTWIYKQLKEHGYLTGYSGESTNMGPFQYRLMGFKDPPTDFYTRPFYMKALQTAKGTTSNFCLGSKPVTKVQFNYVREIFEMFKDKLKFFFSFNAAYSHNSNNDAAKVEPDLLSLLKDLKEKGHLEKTLLIVMGDHGTRYGTARTLLQGKLEERLPLFSMAFPSWFSTRYPKLVANLRTNTDRLTSWYDVYATFRHLLSYPEVPSGLKHGQSLFGEIPASRTCADANVAQHWCPCLEWSAVSANHSHVQNAAKAAVEFINSENQGHPTSAKKCRTLTLKAINYALLERPNEKLLSFHQTNDLIPAFNAKSRPAHHDFCRYQIQFVTAPNGGIYEATVRYHKTWFIVSNSISRLDVYGKQPECIAKDLPHLRKFCLCKKSSQKRSFLGFVKCS